MVNKQESNEDFSVRRRSDRPGDVSAYGIVASICDFGKFSLMIPLPSSQASFKNRNHWRHTGTCEVDIYDQAVIPSSPMWRQIRWSLMKSLPLHIVTIRAVAPLFISILQISMVFWNLWKRFVVGPDAAFK